MTEGLHSPTVLRFGVFEADLNSGELRKSGLKLKLTGQPFQVLEILLERAGEVVTRDELQSRLWPDTFVDIDHNLNAAVNKIREVLGDSVESPRFVETLPRRGYRFIAPVNGAEEKRIGAHAILPDASKSALTPQLAVEPFPTAGTGAQREVADFSRIGKRWHVVAIAAGLIFCAAFAFGIWLVLPAPQPRVVRATQLTNDGKFKCCVVTDGSRVYFSEYESDWRARLMYIPVTGGEPLAIPTPWLDPILSADIGNISPDHDRMLVTFYRIPGDCFIRIVPVTGSAPREVTNLQRTGCGEPGGRLMDK